MEERIFPKPAVAEYLRKYFVEARLHYDYGPRPEENKKLQQKLARSSANPVYVIVQPPTEEVLRKKAGLMSMDTFLEFLRGHPSEGPPNGYEER
jgi:hypothetical protein